MSFNPESYAPEYGWWGCSFDRFKEIGAAIGFDISDIHFSGFWSQGDGACFIGHMEYRKGWRAALAQVCSDATVTEIAERWQALQARCFYQLAASVTKRSHHYSHENTVSIDCEDKRDSWRELPKGAEDDAADIARDFMRWIYDELESEYEYQQAWQLASAWQELAGTAADEKQAARQLIRDIRAAMRDGVTVATSICNTLRGAVRSHLSAMQEALEERAELAENFHYWNDGKRADIAEFAAANL